MRLNPSKCSFGVSSGKFLGYIVTQRGIEANPDQLRAIINIPSPRKKREIQKLISRVAVLNSFISRSIDKCLPFFKLLEGNKKFEWNDKCRLAFDKLKRYLSMPSILAKPLTSERLFLYLAVTEDGINAILVRDVNGEQQPIYYISKSLLEAEMRYPMVDKLALALVTAEQKLRPYF